MTKFLNKSIVLFFLLISSSCSKKEIIETYQDGSKKLECEITQGLKNGNCVGYFQNGKIEFQANYLNDTLDGPKKYFHENGNFHYEVNYSKGKNSGFIKFYDEKGYLYQKSEILNDQLNGDSYSYYPNGNIKTKMTYVNGSLHGFFYSYFEEGQKKIISEWSEGEQIEFYEYDIDGKLINHLIKYDLERKNGQLIIKVTNQKFDFVGLRMGILNSKGDFELQKRYFSENGSFVIKIPDKDFPSDIYYFTLFEVEAFENDPNEGIVKSKVEFQYYVEKEK